jgi:hypothetical protein
VLIQRRPGAFPHFRPGMVYPHAQLDVTHLAQQNYYGELCAAFRAPNLLQARNCSPNLLPGYVTLRLTTTILKKIVLETDGLSTCKHEYVRSRRKQLAEDANAMMEQLDGVHEPFPAPPGLNNEIVWSNAWHRELHLHFKNLYRKRNRIKSVGEIALGKVWGGFRTDRERYPISRSPERYQLHAANTKFCLSCTTCDNGKFNVFRDSGYTRGFFTWDDSIGIHPQNPRLGPYLGHCPRLVYTLLHHS